MLIGVGERSGFDHLNIIEKSGTKVDDGMSEFNIAKKGHDKNEYYD